MTNIVKEWDLNAMQKDKFHWTAPDGGGKKKFDDGLLIKSKLLTWQPCICVA
jgi:hypothetical protein